MVSKVSFLSSWPVWTSRLWYDQLSNRSNFLSPERWKGEFSPPAKILSLSWTSSDILRDNCLVLWSWNMNFLTQWSVLSKMTSPIMQRVPNAILWVFNKNNVHKSESILQNPISVYLMIHILWLIHMTHTIWASCISFAINYDYWYE